MYREFNWIHRAVIGFVAVSSALALSSAPATAAPVTPLSGPNSATAVVQRTIPGFARAVSMKSVRIQAGTGRHSLVIRSASPTGVTGTTCLAEVSDPAVIGPGGDGRIIGTNATLFCNGPIARATITVGLFFSLDNTSYNLCGINPNQSASGTPFIVGAQCDVPLFTQFFIGAAIFDVRFLDGDPIEERLGLQTFPVQR
ncbi:hypothetical protein EV192_10121 [Actinocrispum wychmicini]|uniref:Neocarzinostatin family protein n=2 Tax=Actinocrispum wychmicini TaxID=1213861 RepID=A0A4R2JY79_9PSEU|nr:hypothetical protein EV192_10121 [Actinocrispum wychmicini]